MNGEDVARSVRVILKKFRRFLEPSSLDVLEEVEACALDSYATFRARMRGRREPPSGLEWGYSIHPDKPLAFKPTVVGQCKLQPDLYCTVKWTSVDSCPSRQNVGLRVWSLEPRVTYREHLDSEGVRKALAERPAGPNRRVMLRYHFDLAATNQQGPHYHLQAGGKPRKDELCWLHEGISVPRIPFPPLDLVLAVELVAANFLDEHDRDVLRDPHWFGMIRHNQDYFLTPYYSNCLTLLRNSGQSLLGGLWNVKWS